MGDTVKEIAPVAATAAGAYFGGPEGAAIGSQVGGSLTGGQKSATAQALDEEAGDGGSAMDQYAQYADLLGQGVGFGMDILNKNKADKQAKEDRRAKEQNSMRGEATYRQNRAMLLDQISHFYAKRGWPMPETNFPGQGTSRPLPGDKNPYAGYDVDPSYETHQPLDAEGNPTKFDPNDPNSTVNQSMAKPPSEADQAIQSAGPNLEQAKIAAAQFKPVNQAKALRANLMAQAAGGSTEPIQVEDPMAQAPAAQEAPQFVKYNNQTRTAMPSTNTLGNTGRRQYGY